MSSILVTYSTLKNLTAWAGLPQLQDLQSPLNWLVLLNKLDNSVFYQSGKKSRGTVSLCVWVCVVQSEVMLKEDINWLSAKVEMTLTSGWIIKGAARRRVHGAGWGGGGNDEVRASALKLCQEVCVWANELREEALSQEAWPRERPVVLASPPHTHVTALHTPPLCWSHNTLFPWPALYTHVHSAGCALTRLLCMHSSVNIEMRRQIPVAQ